MKNMHGIGPTGESVENRIYTRDGREDDRKLDGRTRANKT